jgi:hypothetical protein
MAKATRAKAAVTTARALAVRGDDEVDFLGSRAGSTPIGAPTVRAELASLRSRIESLVRHEGREAHEVGTALNTLYMRHADAVLGYDSFRRFLLAEFADDPRRAYEAMVVARAASLSLAAEKGARWVLRAFTWARLEGHGDLARAGDLALDLGDGATIALRDASIRQIDEALGRRSMRTLDEPAGRKVQRARGRVTELLARDPEVAALAPTVYLDNGAVVVRTVARSPDDARALKRLYAAVWSTR